MKLIVDGTPRPVDLTGGETIADLVGMVSRDLDTKRRVVRVLVDGEDITGDPPSHMKPATNGVQVEVTTDLATNLAGESLESMTEFHDSLVEELGKAAEEFRMGSFERSSDIFARCIDGMRVLTSTTVYVVNLLQADPGDLQANQQNLSEVMNKVKEILGELVEAQANRDGILLADLIEYELHPLLEDWKGALDSMKQEVAAA